MKPQSTSGETEQEFASFDTFLEELFFFLSLIDDTLEKYQPDQPDPQHYESSLPTGLISLLENHTGVVYKLTNLIFNSEKTQSSKDYFALLLAYQILYLILNHCQQLSASAGSGPSSQDLIADGSGPSSQDLIGNESDPSLQDLIGDGSDPSLQDLIKDCDKFINDFRSNLFTASALSEKTPDSSDEMLDREHSKVIADTVQAYLSAYLSYLSRISGQPTNEEVVNHHFKTLLDNLKSVAQLTPTEEVITQVTEYCSQPDALEKILNNERPTSQDTLTKEDRETLDSICKQVLALSKAILALQGTITHQVDNKALATGIEVHVGKIEKDSSKGNVSNCLEALSKNFSLFLKLTMLPKETASEETASEETASEETASEETASEETASEETASKETASEETASEETASEETASEETASEETASEETASEETASEETASEETASEETASEETASEETAIGTQTIACHSRIINFLSKISTNPNDESANTLNAAASSKQPTLKEALTKDTREMIKVVSKEVLNLSDKMLEKLGETGGVIADEISIFLGKINSCLSSKHSEQSKKDLIRHFKDLKCYLQSPSELIENIETTQMPVGTANSSLQPNSYFFQKLAAQEKIKEIEPEIKEIEDEILKYFPIMELLESRLSEEPLTLEASTFYKNPHFFSNLEGQETTERVELQEEPPALTI